MFQFRQVLTRMRLGDTDRAIACAGPMGRRKAAQLRTTATEAGWLDPAQTLPEDAVLAPRLGPARTAPAVASLAEAHRELITRWWREGVQGTTIHDALVRHHAFTGSYSSVRRFLATLEAAHPQVTTALEFAPGEAAQVDFGTGPEVLDPRTGERVKTWFFVMTLGAGSAAQREGGREAPREDRSVGDGERFFSEICRARPMREHREQIQSEHRLSKARRCQLLDVARSSAYYCPQPVDEKDLMLMRLIDEIHLRWPFYGSRRMVDALEDRGHNVNRKRVQRLMRLMETSQKVRALAAPQRG